MSAASMTSNRPYLIRAMYDWITDNGLTPHLLVDAGMNGVRVPAFAVKDGQVVLNVAMRAVTDLELGNDRVRFRARFSGASHDVIVPVPAVLAIYAQENSQGMMFPADAADPTSTGPTPEQPPPNDPAPRRRGPQLKVVK
jgi:stringent starvation protein B